MRPADNAGKDAGDTGRNWVQEPIIVLTYPHAGYELLTDTLSAARSVFCTHGAGLLPLCHSAITTWQNVENREATPSALAIKSVRALVSTMSAVIRSGTGAVRWCETAYAGSAAATTFLRIYPETTFLCFHRSLSAVIGEATRAYPWGLGNSPFWPYSVGHAGNNLATIAAYWAAYTRQLLDFEAAHPQSCVRIRHEDLAAEPHQRMAEIFARLQLDTGDLITAGDHITAGRVSETGQPDTDPDRSPALKASPAPHPPLEHMPSQLLEMVIELHSRLGYGSLWL